MKHNTHITSVLLAGIFLANSMFATTALAASIVVPDPGPGTTDKQTPPPGPGTDVSQNQPPITLKNPLKVNSIAEFLELVLKIVTLFALPIIIFFIIYAGFLFVTAQGKPDQITKARNALLYSVVGGVIILGAHLLLAVIQGTVGTLLAP